MTRTTLKGLRARREAAGYTQAELAEKLFVVRAAVSAWEAGTNLPRAEMLPAIARVLHCSIDQLYTDDTAGEGGCPCRAPA